MKVRWLSLWTVCVAAVAATLLPPRPPGGGGPELLLRENSRLPVHLEELSERWQRIALVDSLAPLILESGSALTVRGPGPDELEPPASLVESVSPGNRGHAWEPAVRVGVFRLPLTAGAADGSPRLAGLQGDMEVYAGTHDGRPFCLRVTVEPLDRWAGMAERGQLWPESVGHPVDLLGTCAFVARHGLPGPAIGRWLTTSPLPLAVGRRRIQPGRTGLPEPWVVRQVGPAWSLPPRVRACLAGDEQACSRTLTAPRESRSTPWRRRAAAVDAAPVVVSEAVGSPEFPGVIDAGLLADLEARFGAERFSAFWTSPHPVEEAFSTAFGVSPGRWVMDEGRDLYGAVGRGPRAGRAGWSALVLTLAFGLLVGSRTAAARGRT